MTDNRVGQAMVAPWTYGLAEVAMTLQKILMKQMGG